MLNLNYNERLILPKQAWYVSAEILPCWSNKQKRPPHVNHADWSKMSMHLWKQMCEAQLY